MNWAKAELANHTNPNLETGKLADVIKGADVFVGLSTGNIVTRDMVKSMASDAIVFALASPVPEIKPGEAKKAGAAVVGSSLPEYENEEAEGMRKYHYEGEDALVGDYIEPKGLSLGEESVEVHERYHGVIGVKTMVSLRDERMLGIISTPGAAEVVRSMAKDPIIFALANPVPEIMPADALEAGAVVVATGRSDLANQVNNALAFPGIFRGALDTRSRQINDEMKIAAARGLASLVAESELTPEYVIPNALDLRVPSVVAASVARSAIETGQARVNVDPDKVAARTREYVYEGRLVPLE